MKPVIPADPAQTEIFALHWQALDRVAVALARFARLPAQPPSARLAEFPHAMVRAGGWRLGLARQGVADLAAVMEMRLVELIGAHESGANVQPDARVLLVELEAGRDALLALALPCRP